MTPTLLRAGMALLGMVLAAVAQEKAISVSEEPTIKSQTPIMTTPGGTEVRLRPGVFIWRPELSPAGPVVIIISLPEQLAYVYRNGIAIGVSTVSSGKRGHDTPTGVFTILQKRQEHYSNIYNNAPMPNMQRLTWTGIALHAGKLPGYPASHGCIRLPMDFSKKVFSVTSIGTTVVVADASSAPSEIVYPGYLASVSPEGKPTQSTKLPAGQYEWTPEKSAEGPISILMSTADRMIYVYRNGILIGRSSITVINPSIPVGAGVYTVLEGESDIPSTAVPGRSMPRWMAVGLPAETGEITRVGAIDRVRIPIEFARNVYDILVPGTTLMVTDVPATAETHADPGFTVLADDAAGDAE